jgi:hypothetical protein
VVRREPTHHIEGIEDIEVDPNYDPMELARHFDGNISRTWTRAELEADQAGHAATGRGRRRLPTSGNGEPELGDPIYRQVPNETGAENDRRGSDIALEPEWHTPTRGVSGGVPDGAALL